MRLSAVADIVVSNDVTPAQRALIKHDVLKQEQAEVRARRVPSRKVRMQSASLMRSMAAAAAHK